MSSSGNAVPGDDARSRRLLAEHRTMILATVGQDGLPDATIAPYQYEGAEFYVLLRVGSRAATHLGAVGPIGAAIDAGSTGAFQGVELRGSAELVAEPAEVARVAATLAHAAPVLRGLPADQLRLYRIVPDQLRVLEAATEEATTPGPAALRERVEERTATAGETIVRQGQPADRFYVIAAGECEVVRDGAAGRQVLARLGPGRFFGETGLLAGVPRTATVVAATDVRLLTLSRANFRAALAEVTPNAEELARLVFERGA